MDAGRDYPPVAQGQARRCAEVIPRTLGAEDFVTPLSSLRSRAVRKSETCAAGRGHIREPVQTFPQLIQ